MNNGINLHLVLSGATLVSILTLAFKIWLSGRARKVGPQPFEVRPAPELVPVKVCDERHSLLERQNENLFCRMSAAEVRIAKLESTVAEIKDQYKSIDTKLTELLRRQP